MERQRIARLERADAGTLDPATGVFPLILATSGEASDGDLLSIEGAQFREKVPLQISHINDPLSTAGSISGFRRDLRSTPKRLLAWGQIELDGEGEQAEIRRDLAHMIGAGHVTGISVRWEPISWQRRADLPREHPAHVPASERNPRRRMGVYHERWNVLEGSIVAVGADKAAVVGRAEETEGPVSQFWRSMAVAPPDLSDLDQVAQLGPPDLSELETSAADLDAPSAPDQMRQFVERLRDSRASMQEDFRLFLRWHSGEVLFGEDRERALRLRDEIEAIKRARARAARGL